MSMQMEIKKGKSKKDLENQDLELNGVTKEDIFYKLPFDLKIGEEQFEIKRKSVMEGFRIQKKVNVIVQSILDNLEENKIIGMVKDKDKFSYESLIPIFKDNYKLFSEETDNILELFIENFISEEDKCRLESLSIEDFDLAFNDIFRIIFPFIARPVKRMLSLAQ